MSDVFVFHDNVEYTKQSFTKRTRIKQHKGALVSTYLIVPLKKQSDATLIKDLKIDHSRDWQQRQLSQLRNAYSGAVYFKQYFPLLKDYFSKNQFDNLSDLNVSLVRFICDLLEIECKFYLSSQLSVDGKKAEYNLNLIKYFDGKTYVSGTGGKKYQDEGLFKKQEIDIVYNNISAFLEQNPYPCFDQTFINGLSILDALFNIGKEGILEIFSDYKSTLLRRDDL